MKIAIQKTYNNDLKPLKEETFLEYTIKLRKIREKKKIDVGAWEYKDKIYLVNIRDITGGGIGFSVKATGNYGRDLRRVFRRIQEELRLK